MNAKFYFFSFIGAALLLSSCKTNTDLNSTALVQKRRYTKGFHWNVKKSDHHKSEVFTAKREVLEPMKINEGELTASIEHRPKSLSSGTGLAIQIDAKSSKAPKTENVEIIATPKAITDNAFFDPSPNYVAPMESIPVPAPNSEYNFWLILILTILIPPLGIGLVFGISTEFWISLVLTLLFYFPGLIYSLIILLQVY